MVAMDLNKIPEMERVLYQLRKCKLKLDKFTDFCMLGSTRHTPNHTNVCKILTFQLKLSQLILHLKLCRVTTIKVLFLVLVSVFNFNLFEFSAAILENGIFLLHRSHAFIVSIR